MTNKVQGLYELCIRKVLDRMRELLGRVPEPLRLVSDYELAILNALTSCFPTGRTRGCYFHSGNVSQFSAFKTIFQMSKSVNMFVTGNVSECCWTWTTSSLLGDSCCSPSHSTVDCPDASSSKLHPSRIRGKQLYQKLFIPVQFQIS